MPPVLQRLLVALSIVVTLLGIAALVTTLRLKREVTRLQDDLATASERERILDQQIARERTDRIEAGAALRRERTARSSAPVPQIVPLRSGPPAPNMRSPAIAIGPDEPIVVLDLAVPAALDGVTYRAGLRSAPGDEFWTQSRLAREPDRRSVLARLPATVLPPADYELSLQAVSANGARSQPVYYYFEVKPR